MCFWKDEQKEKLNELRLSVFMNRLKGYERMLTKAFSINYYEKHALFLNSARCRLHFQVYLILHL